MCAIPRAPFDFFVGITMIINKQKKKKKKRYNFTLRSYPLRIHTIFMCVCVF